MRLGKSVLYALRGIVYTYKHEVNFRIQCFFGLIVLVFAFTLHMRTYEKIILSMMIAFVLVLELFNTTIEMFLDLLKPRLSPQVELVKDIMAGAVLLSVIGSLVVAGIIFTPYFIELIR